MADLRNLNNWHWVDINVLNWVKEEIKNEDQGMAEKNHNGDMVTIKEIEEVTGSANVSQRRGNVFIFYELALGLILSIGGEDLEAIVSAFTQDAETIEDLGVEFPKGVGEYKESELEKIVGEIILEWKKRFDQKLMDSHRSKVVVASVKEERKKKENLNEKVQAVISSTNREKVRRVGKYTDTVSFNCENKILFKMLTDVEEMKVWARGEIRVDENNIVQIFSGAVEFKFEELEEGKLARGIWRLRSGEWANLELRWNSERKGEISISLDNLDLDTKDSVAACWKTLYWNGIRYALGMVF